MRVVVAAEARSLAEQVAQLISHRSSVELRAVLCGFDAVSSLADQCDTVILMHGTEGSACLDAVRNLKSVASGVQIVVANMPNVPETIVVHLEAGTTAYVSASDPLTHLPNVLHALERGEVHIEPSVAAVMLDRIVNLRDQVSLPTEGDATTSLTSRQRQVLNLIAHDKSNEEIAEDLFIEVGTVKNHVHRILQKLGARDRREAVRIARDSHPGDHPHLRTSGRDEERDHASES